MENVSNSEEKAVDKEQEREQPASLPGKTSIYTHLFLMLIYLWYSHLSDTYDYLVPQSS